jgi:hypothetical protein
VTLTNQIQKALNRPAPITWLMRMIVLKPTTDRRFENTVRREAIADLVCAMWPKLEGDDRSKVEAIRRVGVKQGIWSDTTDPFWVVVKTAWKHGFNTSSDL